MPDATSGNPLGPSVDGTEISIPSEAQGDLIKRGASNWARFGKGSALQVLRVNAGATDLEYADNNSSFQLIEKKTLDSPGTSFDFTSLTGNSDARFFFVFEFLNNTASVATVRLYINNDTTNANYHYQHLSAAATTASAASGEDSQMAFMSAGAGTEPASGEGFLQLDQLTYANARLQWHYNISTSPKIYHTRIIKDTTETEITRITFTSDQNLATGSFVALYKVTD